MFFCLFYSLAMKPNIHGIRAYIFLFALTHSRPLVVLVQGCDKPAWPTNKPFGISDYLYEANGH